MYMDIDSTNNNNEAKQTVYISFDDNDSSISSFINYLRATFKRHGIYELDDEKDRFFEQIRVLVVVFSSNYKFSMPANLVNHLNKKDLVVVSVLHGVTVSSVKQQIAMLDGSSTVNQVPMWPRVLLESDVLQGHVYNDERSESKFMEEIAKDVFEKLYPTEEIGIHERQLKIENLLCKQPWGLRSVGIFGERGIGKTTIARAVFRRMSGGYDGSCFIKDFHKEYSEKRSLVPLSDEYLGETEMEEYDQSRSFSNPSHRRKRVLIALDDVQDARDAELFLGGGFGPGSLIIITSSDEQVLKECHVNETYELQGLNQEDALKLFTRCVFGKDVTEKNLLEFSMKEIENANGNPSTIREHATRMKEMVHVVLNIRDVPSSGQESSCCVVDNNTSMSIVPYEEVNIELPSPHNVDLVCLMRDFINSTCQVITLVKSRISIYKSYLMCIVVSWVFGWLWNFLGDVEGLGRGFQNKP